MSALDDIRAEVVSRITALPEEAGGHLRGARFVEAKRKPLDQVRGHRWFALQIDLDEQVDRFTAGTPRWAATGLLRVRYDAPGPVADEVREAANRDGQRILNAIADPSGWPAAYGTRVVAGQSQVDEVQGQGGNAVALVLAATFTCQFTEAP